MVVEVGSSEVEIMKATIFKAKSLLVVGVVFIFASLNFCIIYDFKILNFILTSLSFCFALLLIRQLSKPGNNQINDALENSDVLMESSDQSNQIDNAQLEPEQFQGKQPNALDCLEKMRASVDAELEKKFGRIIKF